MAHRLVIFSVYNTLSNYVAEYTKHLGKKQIKQWSKMGKQQTNVTTDYY